MDNNTYENLKGDAKTFYDNHSVQLFGIQFPGQLVEQLHYKLTNQIYDGGEYFQIMDDQNQDSFVVLAKKPQQANSNVFIIDHALSFKYNELHLTIKEPQVERFKNMLKYQNIKKPLFPTEKLSLLTEEFDDMKLIDPPQIKPETESLSLYNNNISSIGKCVEFLQLHKNVKAIWLNNNQLDEEELFQRVNQECPNVQLLNGQFTKHSQEWALKYVTFDLDVVKANSIRNEDVYSLNLSDRGALKVDLNLDKFINLRVIELKDTKISSLEETNRLLKLIKNVERLYCDLSIEEILYDIRDKISQFSTLILVNDRDIKSQSRPSQLIDDLQFIKNNLFKLAGNYRLLSSDQMDESSIWYLMDELGSAIQHNDIPNVKVVPFLYLPNGKIDDQAISYSLLYPTQHLDLGQVVFRDYLNGVTEEQFRSYRLSAWYDIPNEFIIKAYHEYQNNLRKNKIQQIEDQFHDIQYLPKKDIKVLTDLEMVTKNLTLNYISFTLQLEEADLVFLSQGVHDEINKFLGKFINQYPDEYAIVSKAELAKTIQETVGEVPWLQETFNLKTQVPLFLGSYYERQRKAENNIWIIKPPNMARSMDMVVTNNLDVIIRQLETGPKLAQKYIDKPLTLRGKKFDLRFIVALESLSPLSVYIYRTFWIRTANNNYTLDVNSFTDYETHFTVMNYGRKLTQIFMDEFITEFNQEHKMQWDQQYDKIKQMVKELFTALKQHRPEMAKCRQNRAIYGMDVMLDSNHQPKLLEMTFSPDCTRACKFTPSFYNDLFSTLFFGEANENMIKIL